MSGSLPRGGGENEPGIPGECATCNFAYLVRSPCPWCQTMAHSSTSVAVRAGPRIDYDRVNRLVEYDWSILAYNFIRSLYCIFMDVDLSLILISKWETRTSLGWWGANMATRGACSISMGGKIRVTVTWAINLASTYYVKLRQLIWQLGDRIWNHGLLNKQLNCQWLDTPCRICDVIIMVEWRSFVGGADICVPGSWHLQFSRHNSHLLLL